MYKWDNLMLNLVKNSLYKHIIALRKLNLAQQTDRSDSL